MKNGFRYKAQLLLIASIFAAGTALQSRCAYAINRDVHSVIVASEYGLLAGTVVGAAAIAFTQDIRSLFIGSSMGLYLGIAVGVYYIIDRDNPDNPLRYRQTQNASPQNEKPQLAPVAASPYQLVNKLTIDFKYPVLRF